MEEQFEATKGVVRIRK